MTLLVTELGWEISRTFRISVEVLVHLTRLLRTHMRVDGTLSDALGLLQSHCLQLSTRVTLKLRRVFLVLRVAALLRNGIIVLPAACAIFFGASALTVVAPAMRLV